MRRKYKPAARARKTYIDRNGYRRFKDSGISIHRYAAEKKLGRSLRRGEVVHHKNRDKQDNSFRNLQVCSNQGAHWRLHKKDAASHGWNYSLNGGK